MLILLILIGLGLQIGLDSIGVKLGFPNASSRSLSRRDQDGMFLANIPAGPFLQGSNNGKGDEAPAHIVELGAYSIDRYEVSNEMYALCVASKQCSPPVSMASRSRKAYYGIPRYSEYPVVNVNWNQARDYCQWAGARLPTEAEWEKAARGPLTAQKAGSIYPWGDQFYCALGNFDDATALMGQNIPAGPNCQGLVDVTRVGSYPEGASQYGVYDLAGNAWEWVQDWYDAYPGGNLAASPDFGQDYRVIRGGSWYSDSSRVRASSRNYFDPQEANDFIGFRCASDIIEQP